MSMPSSEDLTFRYTAVDRAGRQVRDVVRARDVRARPHGRWRPRV